MIKFSKKSTFLILSVAVLAIFWICFDESLRYGSYTKLIEALIVGVPIVFVTWHLGQDSKEYADSMRSIERQNLFLRMEEKYLQELEAWAEEMVIITGNPEGRWLECTSIPKPDGSAEIVSVEKRQPSDLEINQAHAMAGIKQAFIRHMVTRYGKEYSGGETFPEITIPRGVSYIEKGLWKKRFAKAVVNYMSLYRELEHQTKKFLESMDKNEIPENIFKYEKFFVGMLYNELNAKDSYRECLNHKHPEDCVVSKLLPKSST